MFIARIQTQQSTLILSYGKYPTKQATDNDNCVAIEDTI